MMMIINTRIIYSTPGGATLAGGVSDLKGAISAFNALDGSFVDKLKDFDQLKVGTISVMKNRF